MLVQSQVGVTAMALAMLLCAIVGLTSPVAASDYMNSCRTADGAYEIQDEVLMRTGADASSGRQIGYETLNTTILKREAGYCLSNAAPGQKFQYESKSYVLRITFMDYGRRMETEAICEFAADGLPAAFTCDRQVVTSSTAGKNTAPDSNGAANTDGSNLWTHNGSLMRLLAQGATRTFHYETPREGMLRAGAKPGSILFEGTRNGETYAGTAYIFKAGCPPKGYAVSGLISNGERRITLQGKAPKLSGTCKVQGSKEDILVFELHGE
ncbi:MAG: hypothetical protein ABL894_02045 [Hyphomicrobium sp.]